MNKCLKVVIGGIVGFNIVVAIFLGTARVGIKNLNEFMDDLKFVTVGGYTNWRHWDLKALIHRIEDLEENIEDLEENIEDLEENIEELKPIRPEVIIFEEKEKDEGKEKLTSEDYRWRKLVIAKSKIKIVDYKYDYSKVKKITVYRESSTLGRDVWATYFKIEKESGKIWIAYIPYYTGGRGYGEYELLGENKDIEIPSRLTGIKVIYERERE